LAAGGDPGIYEESSKARKQERNENAMEEVSRNGAKAQRRKFTGANRENGV
jgi:hypothetical protein